MNWLYITAFAVAAWWAVTRRDMTGPDQVAAGGWMPSFGFEPEAELELEADGAWMPTADQHQDTVPEQLATPVETFIVTAQAAAEYIPAALGFALPMIDKPIQDRNVSAFLDMIAYAEGTGGPNGYRTLFGGGLVDSLADHPRQYFTFRNQRGETLRTSAAGRYQFLARTWKALAAKLQLPDFGPQSQDLAAIELIRERGALGDVQAGRLVAAVNKVAPVWASLPGAGYAQPERKLSALLATYTAAGGNMEA